MAAVMTEEDSAKEMVKTAVTGFPRVPTAYGELKDYRQEMSPWENETISQILSPVLGAIFIAVVVFVIACCLIQKKAKSPRRGREKSCHTIETSHDASEFGIYDVIDEVNVTTYNLEKPARRYDKLGFSCLLASQHERIHHPKTSEIFTTRSSGAPLKLPPTTLAPDFAMPGSVNSNDTNVSLRCDSRTCDTRSSKVPEVRISCAETDEDEEGIYETLDRHWDLKRKQALQRALDTTNRPPSFRADNFTLTTHSRNEIRWNNRQSCYITYNPNFETLSHDSSCPRSPVASNVSSVGSIGQPSSECHEGIGSLMCKLTMYQVSGDRCMPVPFETAYYNVSVQGLLTDSSLTDSFTPLLQNAELRIVPVSDNPLRQQIQSPVNLLLKRLKDQPLEQATDAPRASLVQNEHHCPADTKPHDKPPSLASRRYPILLVKKSESFRAARSEVTAAKKQYLCQRRRSDSSQGENRPASCKSVIKQPYITAGAEATRILSKLGPLPPVPKQSNKLLHQTQSIQPEQESSDITPDTSKEKTSMASEEREKLNSSSTMMSGKCKLQDLDNDSNHPNLRTDCRPCDQSEKAVMSSAGIFPSSQNQNANVLMGSHRSQFHASVSITKDKVVSSHHLLHRLNAGSGLQHSETNPSQWSQINTKAQDVSHHITYPSNSEDCTFDINRTGAQGVCPGNGRSDICKTAVTSHEDSEDNESNHYFVLEARDSANCSSCGSDNDYDEDDDGGDDDEEEELEGDN